MRRTHYPSIGTDRSAYFLDAERALPGLSSVTSLERMLTCITRCGSCYASLGACERALSFSLRASLSSLYPL